MAGSAPTIRRRILATRHTTLQSRSCLAWSDSLKATLTLRRTLESGLERTLAMNKRFSLTLVVSCLCLSVTEQASAYYAAHMGRFTSRDPNGEIGRFGTGMPPDSGMAMGFMDRDQFDPANVFNRKRGQFDPIAVYHDGMNLYQYVRSNPILLTDPSGLAPPPSFWDQYFYFCEWGNSAPADPFWMNWGGEVGDVAAVAGSLGAGIAKKCCKKAAKEIIEGGVPKPPWGGSPPGGGWSRYPDPPTRPIIKPSPKPRWYPPLGPGQGGRPPFYPPGGGPTISPQ